MYNTAEQYLDLANNITHYGGGPTVGPIYCLVDTEMQILADSVEKYTIFDVLVISYISDYFIYT